jgi:predicted nucleic acid-binding protein
LDRILGEQIALRDASGRIIDYVNGRILDFGSAAARATASIVAKRLRAGRPGDLRDSMIAGTVLSVGGTLATRNRRHFSDLSIPLIDPWSV